MPKIAEIKEQNGELWVRIDPIEEYSGCIHIWTEDEVTRLKKDTRELCADIASEHSEKAAQAIKDYI